jgi:hypothetical protein
MALGGYKFAGYKCSNDGTLTDAQWALCIHKTRIKAFLDANTSANAGWVFDLNGGTIDFDSTYDGVIYDLGGDGLNLVSYFRNGTSPNAKYYMIASLFSWSCQNYTGRIKISENGPIVKAYYSSSDQYIVEQQSLFHTVSYDPFPEDCLLESANDYPIRALPLIPVSFWRGYSGSSPEGIDTTTANSYFKASKLYFGYAVKDCDIISFTTFNDKLSASDNYLYLRTTLVGFDSLTLSSPSDTANIYGIIFSTARSYEQSSSYWESNVLNYYQITLNDSFQRYLSGSSNNDLVLTKAEKAFFNGATQTYPYETVTLTTLGMRSYAPFLNADGITSKGTFNIELIACNGSYVYSYASSWAPVANGNYLTVVFRRTSTSLTDPQTTYYVGWDASNPNILDESSWTEFSE